MTWVAVGTAAAIGAGVGGVSAAARGDDVLEGALIGGATGALTGGAGAALGSTAASTVGTELGKEVAKEAVTEVAKEGITQAAAEGINQGITQAATEGVNQGITQAATPLLPAGGTSSAGINQLGQGFTQAELNAINQGTADALASGPSPYAPTASIGETPLVQVNPPTPSPTSMTQSELAQMTTAETGVTPAQPLATTPPGTPPPEPFGPSSLVSEPPTNPFMEGFKSVSDYVDKNPFKSAVLGYTALNMTGALNQRSGPVGPQEKKSYKGQYSLSPNFQGGPYSQPNVYEEKRYNYASGGITSLQGGGGPVERMSMANTAMNPQGGLYPQGMIDKTQYAMPIQRPVSSEMVMDTPGYERSNPMLMAEGGIARFAKGTPKERDSYGDFQRYYAMMEGQKPSEAKAPSYVGSVGIAEDNDPDTKYQDALTAALIRQGKINKRANTGIATLQRPTPMGTINLAPPGTQQAASGGIMGYNLGGYADGGNPRLLKGPGDGMSDNIPAVIGRRQPARLADGEFVVPADVVSHLGNGSTDAGAKKLHEMMDKVRVARTGKKKQAPAVKPKKYMPA
jgi:hypothetical protein